MAINLLGAIDSGLIPLLAVICLVMLSITMLRRSQQRRTTSRDVTREQLARLRDQKDVRQSMDELLIQLEEVSRRINAQVDTRFAKLECIIRDADERIAKLERLSGTDRASGAREVGTSGGSKTRTSSPHPPPARSTAQVDERASDSDAAPAADADEFRPGLVASSLEMPAAPANVESLDSNARRQRIHELADAGTEPITIADTLQMPLGEVELILNLRGFGT